MTSNSINNYINNEGYHLIKKNYDNSLLNDIKKYLTVTPNQNNNYVDNKTFYKLYKETSDILTVPKYIGYKNFGMINYPTIPTSINISFKGTLRDYQIDIANTCRTKIIDNNMMGGIITIPCGFGKTVIAIYIAYLLKLKTLIVVHKTFLLLQWIERISQFTDAKIGIIKQDIIDTDGKDIVIGMIQSISKKTYDPNTFNGFGLVIFDECHHTPSKMFSKCLQKTSFMYTIGLSATPNRSDGLTKVMHWYLGKPLYVLQKPKDNNVYVKMFLYTSTDPLFVEKKRWFKRKLSPAIPEMITALSEISGRNILIKNIICSTLSFTNRRILVLSERLEHLDELKTLVDNEILSLISQKKLLPGEINTTKYIGGMKEAQQKLAALGDIIFASSSLAEEGLDIDGLNTLILATPKTKIEQSIGRIMRKPIKEGDVFPLVIDIVDKLSNFETWGCTKRFGFYSKNGYKINKYWAKNDSCISLTDVCVNNGWADRTLLDDEEELKYTYIKNVDSEYEYALMYQEGKLDEYWSNINYEPIFEKIFDIKYDWNIKCLKSIKECEEEENDEDSILNNSIIREKLKNKEIKEIKETKKKIVRKKKE